MSPKVTAKYERPRYFHKGLLEPLWLKDDGVRSVGGDDDVANRTTLCAYHHLGGAHARRVRAIESAPAGLRFELGLRPGERPLLRYRSGERIDAPAA